MMVVASSLLLVPPTHAQSARIKPGSFERNPGMDGGMGAAIAPPAPPVHRATTYFTLTPPRAWTGNDGKTLQGCLIGFEDVKVESTAAGKPRAAKPPVNPTIIKDGKIRLLVGKTPCAVALENLCAADRDYVAKLAAAFDRQVAPACVP